MDQHNLLKDYQKRQADPENLEDEEIELESYHASRHLLDDMKRETKRQERM